MKLLHFYVNILILANFKSTREIILIKLLLPEYEWNFIYCPDKLVSEKIHAQSVVECLSFVPSDHMNYYFFEINNNADENKQTKPKWRGPVETKMAWKKEPLFQNKNINISVDD